MYNGLDNEQIEAMKHFKGPCAVIAGPGSGKTRAITYRIANLIKNNGVSPKNILSISFTRASALEMKERAIGICQESCNCSFGTFHSVFFRMLRAFRAYSSDNVLDENSKKKIIKNILVTFSVENAQDDDFVSEVILEISYIKNDMIPIGEFNSQVISNDELQKVFESYENYKKEMNKIDFDDMLTLTHRLFEEDEKALEYVRGRYKYILIDEFQDINRVQLETVKMLVSSEQNIFVVGDEDQSIYGFRGARPEFLSEFENYFSPVRKIILSSNYRSAASIVESANSLIRNNRERNFKNIKPVREDDGDVNIVSAKDSVDEAEKIANDIMERVRKVSMDFSDFAVIYRTNMQSRAVIDIFMDHNIPFTVADRIVTVYDHWVAKDVIAYLKASCEMASGDDYKRIINKPFRYISKDSIASARGCMDFIEGLKRYSNLHKVQIKTLDEMKRDLALMSSAAPEDAISVLRTQIEYDRYILEYSDKRSIKPEGLFEVLDEMQESAKYFSDIKAFIEHIDNVKTEILEQRKKKIENSVTLTTMHGAKGLEFQNVYVIGAVEGISPHEKSVEEGMEEERRLFYVALTRAKDSVQIYVPKQKYGKSTSPSRFVDEMYTCAECADKGEYVYHKNFKRGLVIEKDEKTITVKFGDGIKVLDYIACLKKKLITRGK
ncbi:DNA helicase-2 / ATP-dependent DNA helicase PcrA [Peptoclostridium litorale DSM 5388]|uniref:DNA 3'-5' helicase n=1 Tax=Peptoclostridium litorale DSM 5388 TaxID=1121324 RepID=A0A069RG71_PEPLI|nr:ATP-dependent helicase [Peptoclostridium litorale]KDR96039.1 UvrD/REP helicase [Peptoclostridium litorale DSM 5388]SIO06068.1 DNA helicase-2 / ATP-dependent DNA helicase PcrA [Peptoclostridium litorale DSM 5388]